MPFGKCLQRNTAREGKPLDFPDFPQGAGGKNKPMDSHSQLLVLFDIWYTHFWQWLQGLDAMCGYFPHCSLVKLRPVQEWRGGVGRARCKAECQTCESCSESNLVPNFQNRNVAGVKSGEILPIRATDFIYDIYAPVDLTPELGSKQGWKAMKKQSRSNWRFRTSGRIKAKGSSWSRSQWSERERGRVVFPIAV